VKSPDGLVEIINANKVYTRSPRPFPPIPLPFFRMLYFASFIIIRPI